MLHALCVIALAVLFSGGTVRLCRIFVKFSGFVVIVVCHVGSINSAPSAQQHAGLRAVPKSHGMVWCGFAESSIKPTGIAIARSRPRRPSSIASPSVAKWARNSHSNRLGVEHVRHAPGIHRDAIDELLIGATAARQRRQCKNMQIGNRMRSRRRCAPRRRVILVGQ